MGRPDRVEESLHPQHVAVAEGARIAHVPADSARPSFAEDTPQTGADRLHRLPPSRPLELARAADALERMQDPVGIVLNVGHRDPLRACVAPGKGVLAIGPELLETAVGDRRDHPAERLADATERDPLLDRHWASLPA